MLKNITVDEQGVGQRIDNFLFAWLKKVPRSRIYRGIRRGEFRVNGSRVSVNYRLSFNDSLRIPPLFIPDVKETFPIPFKLIALLKSCILYEDDQLIALNKPSGVAVHSGSQVPWGVVELLRKCASEHESFKLIHRLDRESSGCLLLAKKRAALLRWHALLRERAVTKQYVLLVKGRWDPNHRVITLPLRKHILKGNERMVMVDFEGQVAETHFRVLKTFPKATLLSADLVTGRTHQIRVHAAAMGHPIAGDEKYGDSQFNRLLRQQGLKRLFLHCSVMRCKRTMEQSFRGIKAPLEDSLIKLLKSRCLRNKVVRKSLT